MKLSQVLLERTSIINRQARIGIKYPRCNSHIQNERAPSLPSSCLLSHSRSGCSSQSSRRLSLQRFGIVSSWICIQAIASRRNSISPMFLVHKYKLAWFLRRYWYSYSFNFHHGPTFALCACTVLSRLSTEMIECRCAGSSRDMASRIESTSGRVIESTRILRSCQQKLVWFAHQSCLAGESYARSSPGGLRCRK
jgi:hypothetical protein